MFWSSLDVCMGQTHYLISHESGDKNRWNCGASLMAEREISQAVLMRVKAHDRLWDGFTGLRISRRLAEIRGWWHHSRFQTGWEWNRCYVCVTALKKRRAARSTQQNTLLSDEHRRTGQYLTALCFESGSCFKDPLVWLVPGGWRTQVSPWVLCLPELQGGDWGQGYLRLSRTIETLLVSHFLYWRWLNWYSWQLQQMQHIFTSLRSLLKCECMSVKEVVNILTHQRNRTCLCMWRQYLCIHKIAAPSRFILVLNLFFNI